MQSSVLFWRRGAPGLAAPLDVAFFRDWAGFVPSPDERGDWVAGDAGGGEDPVIRVCGDCSSAFDVADWLEKEGLLQDWDSVLALSQRAGVGQYGRTWISPPGNLHAVWKLPGSLLQRGSLLPLMVGAALALALEAKGIRVAVKWPNDLVLEDGKLGGVLIRSGPDRILAGIGMNLVAAPLSHELRENCLIQATCLNQRQSCDIFFLFWKDIVQHAGSFLAKMLEKIPDYDVVPALTQRLWRKDRPVRVYPSEGAAFSAVLLGLAGDGALRLLSGKEEVLLYSGSIGSA